MSHQQGYEVKKDRIALVAWKMFMAQGFGATSVDAILQRAGISKGTFYHYYATKDDLLRYAIERIYGAAWTQVRQIALDSQTPPMVRLNKITRTSFEMGSAHPNDAWAVIQATYSDRNLLLRSLLDRRTVEELAPALARVLSEGCEQGAFSLADPDETSTLILRLAHAQKEANARTLIECTDPEEAKKTIANRLVRFTEAVERILGAPSDSLGRVDPSILDAILTARQNEDPEVAGRSPE